jgi:DNA-binding transcriptional MerR regulator
MVLQVDTNPDREPLTIAEAAKFLEVSVSTLRNWDKGGKLKPIRHPINGYRLYNYSELLALKQRIKGIS